MKLLVKLISVSILFSVLFISCGEDVTLNLDDFDTGSRYHPASLDRFWIYKIDSLTITNGGSVVSSSTSFLRESLVSSFLNPDGDTTFILERAFSSSQNGPYFTTDRWTLEKTEDRLLRVEENLQFVKLLFPIQVGTTWNGNLFDDQLISSVSQQQIRIYRDWEYSVLSDNDEVTVEGVNYQDVVTVQQAEFETALELRRSREEYAPDVGLIRREMEIFDTQCIDQACQAQPWLDKAMAGFQLTQVLVDHN